jgi:hypothetical protein
MLVAVGFVAVHLGGEPGIARADMVSASAEFDATLSSTKTKDASGAVTSNSSGNGFIHRYNVALDLNPYPLMKVFGGSLFKQEINTLHDINSSAHSTDTVISPFVNIGLGNRTYYGGVGYSKTDDTQTGTQAPTATTTQEEYHGHLFWKPQDFPDLVLNVSHINQFASQFAAVSVTDRILMGTSYSYKTLRMNYSFSDVDTLDKTNNVSSTVISHNAMASYADNFFKNRVNLYANYNISYLESTTTAGAGGSVDTQLFPLGGLSAFNLDPTVGTADQNVGNTALIDGNLTTSAGINLGVVPAGSPTANNKWSIGVDFVNTTQLNTILIRLDRALPAPIWTSFTWQIYVRNNDTDNWTLVGAPATVSFQTLEPFPNSFRLGFSTLSTRFIKVVVSPLAANVAVLNPSFPNPDRIFVTEIQTFINQPAAQIQGTRSTLGQALSCDVRTRLLSSPSLYHSLHLNLTTTSPGGTINYILANTLSLDHRINSVFSVGASVGREDIKNGGAALTAYTYTASVKAVPLRTLSHTLVYSGRIQQSDRGSTYNDSIFLTNTAQVYKGIAFNLSVGYSLFTSEIGSTSENIQFIGSGTFAPRPDLSLNVSYGTTLSSQSGGGVPSSSRTTENGNLTVTYRPFTNLYLFTSFGSQATDQRTEYTQNYGANWSPFPEGDLQFNFNYTDNFTNRDKQRTTTISPSITWRIARNASLDASYAFLTSESTLQSSDSDVFSAILRVSF